MIDIDAALEALSQAQIAYDKHAASTVTPNQLWSQALVIKLAIAIIGLSTVIFLLVAVLMWRNNSEPQHILRIFGILTIITFSALLMVVGYSNEQLTPIIGLFGAVAGYLLGRDSTKPSPSIRETT